MGFNLIYWTHIVGSNLEKCGNLVDMARFGKYIDNTDWVVNPLQAQSRGRRLPRRIQCVRIFYHVSFVFMSPPGVEFCVLSLYSEETDADCQCSDRQS